MRRKRAIKWFIAGIFFVMIASFCAYQRKGEGDTIIPNVPTWVWLVGEIVFFILSAPMFIMMFMLVIMAHVEIAKGAVKVTKYAAKATLKAIEEAEARREKEEKERPSNGDGTFAPSYSEIRIALMHMDSYFCVNGASAEITKKEIDMSLNRKHVKVKVHVKFKIDGSISQSAFDDFCYDVRDRVLGMTESRLRNDTCSSSSFSYTVKFVPHM